MSPNRRAYTIDTRCALLCVHWPAWYFQLSTNSEKEREGAELPCFFSFSLPIRCTLLPSFFPSFFFLLPSSIFYCSFSFSFSIWLSLRSVCRALKKRYYRFSTYRRIKAARAVYDPRVAVPLVPFCVGRSCSATLHQLHDRDDNGGMYARPMMRIDRHIVGQKATNRPEFPPLQAVDVMIFWTLSPSVPTTLFHPTRSRSLTTR